MSAVASLIGTSGNRIGLPHCSASMCSIPARRAVRPRDAVDPQHFWGQHRHRIDDGRASPVVQIRRRRQSPRSGTGGDLLPLSAASGEPLVVPDAAIDPRFTDNPHVPAAASRFYAGVPLRSPDGHVIGTICAVDTRPRDFSDRELKILEDLALITMNELELRQRATIDVLTGALSRRAFKEEGNRAASLASRHNHALACLVFDLDHFKSVNDRFGHAAGDRVLTDAIKACVDPAAPKRPHRPTGRRRIRRAAAGDRPGQRHRSGGEAAPRAFRVNVHFGDKPSR